MLAATPPSAPGVPAPASAPAPGSVRTAASVPVAVPSPVSHRPFRPHTPRRAPVPASRRAFVRWVPEPTAATVPLVRGRVRALLEGWRIASDVADTFLLAVSELVGNVVRHAAATGRMRVAVSCGGGWLCLEVADAASALPRLPDPAAEVDRDAEGGRGLLLVQLMAAEVGGELVVIAHELGKRVRVRVPLA
ncbi:ATP-binding protein [Streptomyces sp. NPDC047971]|uniref:ATP-binding protein n=1 Tax=Streptomyces sp. NPDC047971 TaxID=3154499 RepID=UPI0033EC3ACE